VETTDQIEQREERDSALATFRRPEGPRCILIRYARHNILSPTGCNDLFVVSTKCGGVGLNLVSANRIVK
jgi:hypothetical protein